MRLAITEEHQELSRISRSVLESTRALAGRERHWTEPSRAIRRFGPRLRHWAGWASMSPRNTVAKASACSSSSSWSRNLAERSLQESSFPPRSRSRCSSNSARRRAPRWLPALCNGTVTAAVGLAGALTCSDAQVTQGTVTPVWGTVETDLYFFVADEDVVVLERAEVHTVQTGHSSIVHVQLLPRHVVTVVSPPG